MDTIKRYFTNFVLQCQDLAAHNKTATITLALVSFVLGAILF